MRIPHKVACYSVTGGIVLSLLVTGCSSSSSAPKPRATAAGVVPSPLTTVPPEVRALSQTVGEYVVTPDPGVNAKDAEAASLALRGKPGVQSSEMERGLWHVQVLPDATAAQRDVILKHLAAVGKVAEGI
jgi:hypothetical protein